MLVRDEARQQRDAKAAVQESYADKVNRWTMEQLGNARVISDTDLSAINPQRQMGKMLQNSLPLEAALLRLSPNFVFEEASPTKKRLKYQVPGEPKPSYICLFESGPTPEYSIFNAQYRWEPDPDYAQGIRTLQRADVRGTPVSLQTAWDLLRDKGVEGAKQELLAKREGEGLNDPGYRPGFIRVLEQWREAVRGWRSVLARVLQSGYLNLDQVKKAEAELALGFDPASQRATWARLTGQRTVATL